MNTPKMKIAMYMLPLFIFSDAFAYLDPGTGSILIQGLIAAVVGGLVVLKLYWYKFKSLFTSRDSKAEKDDSQVNPGGVDPDLPKK